MEFRIHRIHPPNRSSVVLIEEELRHVDFKLEPLEWVLYAYTIMLKVDNLIDLELGSDLGLIHLVIRLLYPPCTCLNLFRA